MVCLPDGEHVRDRPKGSSREYQTVLNEQVGRRWIVFAVYCTRREVRYIAADIQGFRLRSSCAAAV